MWDGYRCFVILNGLFSLITTRTPKLNELAFDSPRIAGKWSESSRLGSVPVRLASRLVWCAGRIVAAPIG